MTVDAEQQTRLLAIKVAALARPLRTAAGTPADELAEPPTRAGAITAFVDRGTVYALAEHGTAAALASAVLWAHRREAERLVLFTEERAGDLARWASYFTLGATPVEVREIAGATSHVASSTPAAEPVEESGDAEDLLQLLRDAGVEVVVEHGVIRGEILGLEVARLVRWPLETGGDGELHLEPGVGRFDRDAVAAAHPDEAPAHGLARTVFAVRSHRYPGAPAHPIQMLVRERWVRADIVADPSLVGAAELRPVDMTTEAFGMRDAHPAAAYGTDLDGNPLLVVCSTGVDLALVPLAADTRDRVDPGARLVLALPARDHHAATTTLAGLLVEPAELAVVASGWS